MRVPTAAPLERFRCYSCRASAQVRAVDRQQGANQRPSNACLLLVSTLPQSVANEVRLYLARGLDRVWEAPCAHDGRCHHEVGLSLATGTLRDCTIGPWVPDTGRRTVVALEEPFTESLTTTDDDSILTFRLDAAIRALAPAATGQRLRVNAGTCFAFGAPHRSAQIPATIRISTTRTIEARTRL